MTEIDDALKHYKEWIKTLPDYVRVVAEKFDPTKIYIIKQTKQKAVIRGFGEDKDKNVTVKVLTSGGVFPFPYEVFGINPDDLILYEEVTR